MNATRSILLVLPMAFQDGQEKYSGIMRFLQENDLRWSIRLDRLSPSVFRPTIGEKDHFDGAIIDGTASMGLIRAYVRSAIPLVAIDWRHPEMCKGRRQLIQISSDNAEIGRMAARALSNLHPFASFAYLPLAPNSLWSGSRGRTFAQTLKRKGRSVVQLDPSLPLGPQLLSLPKPAALFAANDAVGAKVLDACVHSGISVPEDLSVLGVDNERFTCLHTDPPLATIQPDFERAGYLAAQALDRLLHGRSVKRSQMYHVRTTILRRSLEPAGTAGRLVQRALELINDHALEYRTIDELADALDISRRLLDRRFRQIVGRSVLDVIQDKRLESVCTLLKTTELPISEICASCSFGSGTYPLRLFKARMGMTMRAYRLASHT
mgnify:CR=1 FL=1